MGSLAPVGKALEKVQDVTGEGAVEVGRGVGIDPSSETAATLYAAGSAVPDAVGMLLGAKAPKLRSKPGRPNAAIESIEELTAPKDSSSPAALTNQADTLEQTMPRQPEAAPVKESAKKTDIRQAIQNGDKAGAQYVIDNRGQIVTDKAAKRAISQGFSDGAVATIKNSSKADRARMLKMLNVAERGLKNPTHRARFRPSDVIGDSIMERWNVVSTANKKARTEITAAAQKELAGKQVDISDAVDSFADALDELGVQVGDDGLTFKGSQIEGSDIAPIKRVFDRLNAQGDGLSLHRLKQYIDSQIDWDKPTKQKPLDQKAVNALKDLRRNINEKLKAESEAYADANARAAETFGVMGDMMDVMGRRFDPHGENASVYAGQEMRKILSNYGKRADMIQAMDKLDEVAGKYGGKFTDDPINQVVFYSDMERLFGSFADNSLQGVMQKGVGKAIDATVGGQSKTGMIAEGMKAAFDKASGVNEQGAIRAMRELLQRQ